MRQQQPRRQVAVQAQHAVVERTREFQIQLDQFGGNLAQALPKHVPLDRFKRIAATAVAMNPDLLGADRRTLFLALVKAASDGLMPDGRECALVVYNTEIKMRNPQGLDERFRIDAVQYMPMIGGIRERMRRTGEVASADAQVVCRNDKFRYRLGDDPHIEHEPPPLDEPRGDIVGAYAVIKLKNGEVLRDVMSVKEIELARSKSRAGNGIMWTQFYGEAARKTVLRRCSKAAPQTSEIERLMERDEEPVPPPEPGDLEGLQALQHEPEAEPVRSTSMHASEGHEPEPSETIEVPKNSAGLPDYKAWAFGMFLPKVRAIASSEALANFSADNEPILELAKQALSPFDKRELESELARRWDELLKFEEEPVA